MQDNIIAGVICTCLRSRIGMRISSSLFLPLMSIFFCAFMSGVTEKSVYEHSWGAEGQPRSGGWRPTVDSLLNGRLKGRLGRVAMPAHFHVVIHQERMRDTLCTPMQIGGHLLGTERA